MRPRWVPVAIVLALAGPAHAQLGNCDAETGSPPAPVILGPEGEQFRPENTACPDAVVAPKCKNGTVLTYVDDQDPDRLRRYACVSSPERAESLPLLVFLHGSRVRTVDIEFGGQGILPPRTSLQELQSTADLGGRGPGFVLLMPQGRCMEARVGSSGDGMRFDVWHKDPVANLDIRAIRAFIRQVRSRITYDEEGNVVPLPDRLARVDPKRVYLMNASEGGYFSHLLALSYPDEFAAVASFAAASPFSRGPCSTPFPDPSQMTRRPGFMMVHAECDPVVPCGRVEAWIDSLTENGWAPEDNVDVVTDSTKIQVLETGCRKAAETETGKCPLNAHLSYADPRLPDMFEFLRRYELP